MQGPGRRPFAGVDLRRPKGYPAASTAPAEAAVVVYVDPCPRCESRDTKFCYYNNYNASQPRHYCKSCRRYWTKGGSLRDVPVGGGSRKSPSSSSSPKRAKSSKRLRVGSAAPPEHGTAAADAATTAEAGATVEDGPDHPSVALGLGVADETGWKEPPNPSPFEWPWPSGCDLWSFGSSGVFADTDPALFLARRESWSIEPDSGS